ALLAMDALCRQPTFDDRWLRDPRDFEDAPKRRRLEATGSVGWHWEVAQMLEQWHSTQFMEVESPASDVDLPAVQNSASLHVQIFVRDLSDTTRVIHVGLDSHISDVKRVICAKAQTSADAYYLTYIGKRLEDEPTASAPLGLPIRARSGSCALPIQSRTSVELPVAGRSVVQGSAARDHTIPVTAPVSQGVASAPLGQCRPRPDAASCGVALFNCALGDEWEEESIDSPLDSRPIVKAKSNPTTDLANSLGDETPVSSSHKRMSSAVNYKGFISQHGADISVYDRYEFGRLLGEGATGSTWEAFPRLDSCSSIPRLVSGQCSQDGARAVKKVLKGRFRDGSTESFLAEIE
ncbi:unnamed protein product, partial [Symbiodinium sp. KB8]